MAPSSVFEVTHISTFRGTNIYYANGIGYIKPKKVETKKERIQRIAKEKMFASWKLFNQKTPTVIEIKQFCKPRHNLNIR